ncbi:hypothetical protein ALC56_06719 [Trachymyrmex septentrionalis]|uniref:Uncharacterized protein n=1 Tax=Trachymyrmex septentrionalis TaxID=34720 RepID=A0A195FDI4_9HYME|nr:hypothetical protein ALC56_06719 [Trachymyrmex septentrionalis]
MANVGSAPNAPGRDTQNSRLPRDIRHIVAIASDGLRLVGGDLNVLCGERPGSVIRRIRASSAEAKSQPLRRRSSRDPREPGKTKGSHPRIPLCPGHRTLARFTRLIRDTSPAEPGTATVIDKNARPLTRSAELMPCLISCRATLHEVDDAPYPVSVVRGWRE